EVEAARRGRMLGRPLPAMERLRARNVHAAEPARARPRGEIEVLVVDKEALVEPAESFEERAPHQKKRAHDLVHLPRLVMRPFGDEMRWEYRRHQPVESETGPDHRPCGRRPRGVARDLAVRIEQPDAGDANGAMLCRLQ